MEDSIQSRTAPPKRNPDHPDGGVRFTPGPWRIHDMECDAIVAGRPGAEVANVANSLWRDNMRADAHLIAAAPDLLKALQLIADEPREDAAAWMRSVARAAINKAKATS